MPKLTDDNPYYYLHKRQELYRKNTSNPPELMKFDTKEELIEFTKNNPCLWHGYDWENDV